jgi:HMG (high mobility group) box
MNSTHSYTYAYGGANVAWTITHANDRTVWTFGNLDIRGQNWDDLKHAREVYECCQELVRPRNVVETIAKKCMQVVPKRDPASVIFVKIALEYRSSNMVKELLKVYNYTVEDRLMMLDLANTGSLRKEIYSAPVCGTFAVGSAKCEWKVTFGQPIKCETVFSGTDIMQMHACTDFADNLHHICNWEPWQKEEHESLAALKKLVARYLDKPSLAPSQDKPSQDNPSITHPKNARSGYMAYGEFRRPQLNAASPKMEFGEITKQIALEWNAMSDAEKQSYNASADIYHAVSPATDRTFKLTYADIKHTLLFRGEMLVSVDGAYGASVHDLVGRMRTEDILAEIKQDMRTWFDIACYLGLDIKTKMLWRTFDYTINDVEYKVQFSRECKAWECPEIPYSHTHLFNDLNSGTWKPWKYCCTTDGNISGTMCLLAKLSGVRVFTWLHGRVPEWGRKMISAAEARELIADHARW